MPQPTQSQVHVDTLLTNMLVGFKNAAYIADDASPILPVDKQTNIIPRVNQSAFFRDDAKLRAAGTRSARSGFTVDNTLTYFCPRFSLGHEIPDEVRDNTDAPYDMDRESAFFVANALQLARERMFASNMFSAVWGSNKVQGVDFNQWSNYAGSTPLEDVTQWKDQIEGLIGIEANQMVIGKQVWVGSGGVSNGQGLKWHPELIDTVKYTQRGQLSLDTVASLFELDRILVGRAIFTATPETAPAAESSVVYQRIFGKNVLVFYNPPGPSIFKPMAMATVVWNRVASAIQYIKRFRDEQGEFDVVEGNSYFVHKQIVANAGIFATGAVN